ncbi:MAG: hypothetical protein QMD12_02165 [Candidatus Aenigmarchaeota archaeon]|nr:hypothetical protein [Candidatus Aenigmarchaeota archaeon]
MEKIEHEPYEPILKKIRDNHGEDIEEKAKSRIEALKKAFFADPELKNFAQEDIEKFIYSQADQFASKSEEYLHYYGQSASSVIRYYLPYKEEDFYP